MFNSNMYYNVVYSSTQRVFLMFVVSTCVVFFFCTMIFYKKKELKGTNAVNKEVKHTYSASCSCSVTTLNTRMCNIAIVYKRL